MRNTSWQAAVADMRAAGINPAVAYSKGGAASPGGATAAAAENTVSSAMQAIRLKKDLELMTETVREQKAKADQAEDSAHFSKDRRRFFSGQTVTSIPGPDGKPIDILNGANMKDLWQAELGSAKGLAAYQNYQAAIAANQAKFGTSGLAANYGPALKSLLDLVRGIGPASNRKR